MSLVEPNDEMSSLDQKGAIMKAFKATGTFLMGKDIQPFSKEVAAKDKNEAEELVYSIMGSKHNVKRFRIDIEKLVPIKDDEITDQVIAYKIKEAK